MIGGAPDHDAIDVGEVAGDFCERSNATIDSDQVGRQALFEAVDAIILKRRNVAVFFRRESLEPRFAGMDDHAIASGGDHRIHELIESGFGILIIDTEAAFDGDGQGGGGFQRGNAFGHKRGLAHQAGAEASFLHAVRRATDIEINLAIAKIRGNSGRLREFSGV